MYIITGYDKDNDAYMPLHKTELPAEAKSNAKTYAKLCFEGKLNRVCSDGISEPIDWICVENQETGDMVSVFYSANIPDEMSCVNSSSGESVDFDDFLDQSCINA